MNESIIRELAFKAGAKLYMEPPSQEVTGVSMSVESVRRFAELIVQECAGLCDQAAEQNARTVYAVTETQEVGPVLVARGSQVQAEKLAKEIRKHFGVEE